jgi:hypothetical protein
MFSVFNPRASGSSFIRLVFLQVLGRPLIILVEPGGRWAFGGGSVAVAVTSGFKLVPYFRFRPHKSLPGLYITSTRGWTQFSSVHP